MRQKPLSKTLISQNDNLSYCVGCWLIRNRVNFPTKLLVFANTPPHVVTWWESTKSKESIWWVPQIRSPQFMAKTIH